MSTLEDAMDTAEDAAGSLPAEMIERIANRLGAHANAKAVFGDPVERDGVTVIPVAQVRWGFGGGAGTGKERSGDTGSGSGGGGGVMAKPVGYIEIRDGKARFIAWTDPVSTWPLVIAGAVAAWIVLRGLRAIFR